MATKNTKTRRKSLSGQTDLKLILYTLDGTLVNGSGDALTENGSSGVFAASVTAAVTSGYYWCDIVDSIGSVLGADGLVYFPGDTAGTYWIGDPNLLLSQIDSSLSSALTEFETDFGGGGDIDGFTRDEAMKLLLAGLCGKLSGGGTTSIAIRAADDSKVRISATVDKNRNRSEVELDAS